jgi:transposase
MGWLAALVAVGNAMVTDRQVKRLRKMIEKGKTLGAAAAVAGMSERTARKWKNGGLPSQSKQPRKWRTRQDPFAQVWETEIVPLLRQDEKGILQATFLLEFLQERYPERFDDGHVRTLQRRLSDWRALQGPEKEVIFPQEHIPGREGAFDFTSGNELNVTIGGQVFVHLIFEFVLTYSGWRSLTLAFSETFEAMLHGIQTALYKLGAVPAVWRSDNLSAATHELRDVGRQLTRKYREVLEHYGAESTRIAPGKAHENGTVEGSHRTLKSLIEQALLVRGHRNFKSVEAYIIFLQSIEAKLNRHAVALLEVERAKLLPLPSAPLPEYTLYQSVVRSWSTINIGGRIYSVPSRLKGKSVEVRQYAERIEIWFRGQKTETMPRLRGDERHRIDYRHVIWSLVRKPGAFARYKFREELFPSLVFRHAYDALVRWRGERADVEYVRILHLAASTMQRDVEAALSELLEQSNPFTYHDVKNLAAPEKPTIPIVHIPEANPAEYDRLLAVGGAR